MRGGEGLRDRKAVAQADRHIAQRGICNLIYSGECSRQIKIRLDPLDWFAEFNPIKGLGVK
jgi:hypothetical protein